MVMEILSKNIFEIGSSFLEFCKKIRALLPLAFSSFFVDAYKTLLDIFKIRDNDSQAEPGILSNGSEHERANNVGRAYTSAFRYTCSRKYYIQTRLQEFKDLICSGMFYFTDCYIIHTASGDSTFVLFDSTQVLSVVGDSDEELGSDGS